jgi:AmmeMemoRadiSam system protein B
MDVMPPTIRQPAVAGRFYPRDPDVLRAEVNSYLAPPQPRLPALGCVVPHAGYMYSGHVAGAVFARLEIPQHCILLCPNHTGLGQPLSIMSSGGWLTPLGAVPIDADLAERLKQCFSFLSEDNDAHRAEHAAEVELPFLQVLRPDVRFVPIALGTGRYEVLENLGQAIAEVLTKQDDRVLIIASSDMNHYENDAITRIKDHKAIDRILALDPRGLFDVVMKEEISMCGYGPTVAMLTAARQLGATRAGLVKYATSGDVSEDRNMVVGYAGVNVS